MQASQNLSSDPGLCGRMGLRARASWRGARRSGRVCVPLVIFALLSAAIAVGFAQAPALVGNAGAANAAHAANRAGRTVPPRVRQAQRFLAQRGWKPRMGLASPGVSGWRHGATGAPATATSSTTPAATSTSTWGELGPIAVTTPNYGLVTGRVSALALDPSDPTGNRLYLGTTGGGVWVAQNADVSNPSYVMFTPLTDTVAALSGAQDASISIGALTVQPGGTGVILAGTGDPNDALDSYYGVGVLRSADGGNTWTLTQTTADQKWAFAGEGFAGFAWSTTNPQVVVAAVSQAYEGTLVNADRPGLSYEGLYYSADSGATWSLATITDGASGDVQGPNDAFAGPDGNAATSVVWNPVRNVFVAAVRYHGYYQSTDGATWTRMAAQPGAGLTPLLCPTNATATGSIDCPIFRGTLAVNLQTGDTFAWTVDIDNQDQGLWQDACALSGTACTNATITFAQQWNTAALETTTLEGAATIANGDYNLALAAVPAAPGLGEDTLLLAGANDLWKCSLAMGCVWRNTTNADTCMSAQVAGYQHALGWNTANPLEIFVGNDSGLWRSTDAIGETGAVCASTDSGHFQNLNGSMGSLAEVVSMSPVGATPFTMMAGLGVNGTAGVKSGTGPIADWPQILGGDGGPVAIDPDNSSNWYVNNEWGVSIYQCAQAAGCTAAAFGSSPVVNDADVGGDGYTMTTPAPFLVDPLDTSQLLIGTCRVWRGPADGVGWSGANAISPILDSGASNVACSGNALIRSMAAQVLAGGKEVVYLGMFGSLNGGATLPGHVLSATINPASSTPPVWNDLTLNPVSNDTNTLNFYGLDISSIFIDPHDATGNTVYVTVEGMPSQGTEVLSVYGSTDGGAHWSGLTSNLPEAPANSLVVDPQNAGTVYLATDVGVYFTTQVANCVNAGSNCWSAFGNGLPEAPVVGLSAASAIASAQVLVAATYGRGIWQTGLWTGGTNVTTATATPTTLTFASQAVGTTSGAQTVTVTNTGSVALTVSTPIAMSGDFSETDNCQNASVAPGLSCSIQVTFAPTATGARTGQMTISANIGSGQLTVALSGTGTAAGVVTLTPVSVDFGEVEVGTTSPPLQVAAGNSGATAIPITSVSVTPPFTIASNSCGTSSLAADTDCQLTVEFAPTQAGAATGTLTLVDGAGTQAVALTGTGEAAPTDALGSTSLTFPGTIDGLLSTAQTVSLTNSGGEPLTSIAVSVSGPFQVSSNCGTQLVANSSCSISVVFAPLSVGILTGTLTVSDILRTQTVSLTGTGVQAPLLSVSPASLSFAAQPVGVASAPLTLTVSNTGGAPMANVGSQINGVGASSFSAGTTTCGASLNNGSSCTVQVIYTPATAGGSAATMVISSSTLGVKAVSVPLNGAGQGPPGLGVNPTQLIFPTISPGQSSAAQTVTISNTATVAASALTLTVSSQFSLTQDTCSGSLAAGASCAVGVIFQPIASGAVTGVLTVSSPTVPNSATVVLSGTGGGPGVIQAVPAVVGFGSVGVGIVSNPLTVTLTNTGTTSALDGMVLTAPAGFQLVSNTCASTLGPGASCTTGVVFAPTSAGAQNGTLTVTSSTASATAAVALVGTGFDFTVATIGATSQSVASGLTASYTLLITPLNGSQGAFTFQCGAVPANVVCFFNPATETVSAGAQGNVDVEIATGQAGPVTAKMTPPVWGLLPLICGLVVLPLGWRRRRKALLLVALLAILAGGVSSCTTSGGGTGGASGVTAPGATPSGTYSIPVTVTSTGVQHGVTVTLTVD